MRNAFAEALYQEALNDPRIYVVVADISPVGSIAKFREEFPDRFINVGVSEQAMIGVAAGLALKGMRPFCYTIATFALYRAFEFVRDDLCYQNLPVVVVGMGAGLSYPDHGGTHQAIEDVAVASAMPNMQVIAPCDPFEVTAAVQWCARENRGPVYLRLGKSGEPILNVTEPWFFGSFRRVFGGGYDRTVILSYGPITKMAVEIAQHCRDKKKLVSVFSCHALKPFDRGRLSHVLSVYHKVIVLEEHVPRGGLASLVKEVACDEYQGESLDIHCFTLKDEFVHCNGKRDDMLAAHGLNLEVILKQLALP